MSSISSLTDSDRSRSELLAAANIVELSSTDKKPSASEKPSSSNTGVGAQQEPATGATEEVEIVDGARIVKLKDPIAEATLADVEISDTPVYFIKMNSKSKKKPPAFTDSNSSRVIGIRNKTAVELKTEHLRNMCRRYSLLRKIRNPSKATCLQALAHAKKNPPSIEPKKKKKKPKPNKLNAKRFCNAIFCEAVRPQLAFRGRALTKDELTAGLKTDQLLHEAICKEYNDTSPENGVAVELFSHLTDYGSEPPDEFYGPINWMQAREALKNLLKDYDKCFHNWKKSGNHGGLGDRLPFADFSQSSATLVYLHEFVYQYPNIFEKVTGELPSGAFSESLSKTKKKNSASVSITSSATKKRRATVADNSDSLAEFNRNSAAKNKAIEYNMLMQSYNKAITNVEKQQDRKRELFETAMEHSTQADNRDRKSMKNRYKNYKSLLESLKEDGNSRSSEDSSIGFDGADSQESKFKLMLQCDRNRASLKDEKKYVERQLAKAKEADTKKKNKENEKNV